MTNFEATAYARIALLNLIESKTEINCMKCIHCLFI